MKVPLLDLKLQYQQIKTDLRPLLDEIFESQQFVLGPNVEDCEKVIADYSQSPYACGVSSGTDALLMSLMAENIGEGDEVITTPYTFFATAGSIVRVGAQPVFVDIDPISYNLDVSKIEEKMTASTKAIMPVHLYGQSAEMDPILKLVRGKKITVIEDCAQAIGAEYKEKRVGSMGDYGCFSFFPSKNLGVFGDGGMVVCQSLEKLEKLKFFRNHGSHEKYYHKYVGGNFRLDSLQAVVASVKMKHLDSWSDKRNENAHRYQNLFEATNLIKNQKIVLPKILMTRHIFNQYVIRVPNGKRDALKGFLTERGVGCEVYYPVPMHLQECFKYLGYGVGDFPEAEKASKETLAIPIYPELTDEQLIYVVESIESFFRK
jgi:dTDP-4-amino-4,6-dideoxygalactose transaminase